MIFKTIEDETTISGQRIVGALEARRIAQQQATIQLETDIACLKKYEIACQSGSVSTEQFDTIMKKASITAKEYTVNIQNGTGSAQSYAQAQKANNAALQSVEVGANVASRAVKLLSATMNTIAFTAIFSLFSKGISWVTKQIDNYIHRNEIAIEKAEELLDTFKSEIDTITSNQDKINGYSDEFEELSKGVDDLGRNVSLTADEYSRYQSIVKEIVGINPSLISGYDEENNILANKNGLIETSIQLLKDEYNQKLKNLALPDNVDTAIEGAVGRYSEAKDKLQVAIDDVGNTLLSSTFGHIDENGNVSYGYADFGLADIFADVIGVDFDAMEQSQADYIYENMDAILDNMDAIKERASQTKDGIQGLSETQLIDLMDYLKELRILYTDMNNASSSANSTLQYVAMAEDSYYQLSDVQKKLVAEYVNGIKITSDTTEQEKENIRKSIISLVQDLSDLDDTEIKNAIENLYKPLGDDESVEDYKKRIKSAIRAIQEYCDENGIEIPIKSSQTDSIDKLMNSIKDKLKGTEFDDKVGELNLNDLNIASRLKVPSDSIQSWEELIGLIEKVKTSNIDKVTLSTQLTNSKEALETFTSSVHSAFDAYSTLMNPNVSSADMLSSITQLSELAKTMGKDLNWEMLYGFGDTVTQLGSSIEYISEEYAKSVLSGAGIDSKFVDMLAHSIVQAKQAETQLSRLDSQIDSLQSSYTDLTDIIETYNSNGYITFDQLQKLLALEPQYLACLVDENGQLSLNNESMRLLAEQRLNEARAQIIQQAITELSELVTHKETTALADNITTRQEQLGKLSEYSTKMADAIAKTAVETELVRELNAELGNASANGASEKDINQVLDNAYKKFKLVDKIGSTDLTNTLGGSSSKSAKSTAKTFDWIETLISRIQRNITNLGKVVSATYRNWSTRNNALAQEMAEVNKEINAQMTAYNAYIAKANSIGLSDHYKNLVMNGGLKIEDIGNEALREQIESFKEYYEKALDASDAIEDLRANLADLAKTKFDNISEQYDEQISLITHNVSMLEGFVSQSEAAGYMASEVYYKAMADKQQENIAQLQGEYSSLLSAFDEAVKSGSIEKYSSDWYDMLGNINDVEQSLQDATTRLVEFNQTLQQLSWEVFDRIRESVNDITTEAEFLIDVLDSKDLHTDKGAITDEGLAVQGLHAVNYNTYMEQAIAYAEELSKIEAEMANDSYDMELVDRRNELLELQQEAIQNANAEKESIVDLYKNGYDKMLDSLDKLIQKRKSALQLTKDMYDYEKNISEQTSNIASLRKQLQAYATDNSESAKSTIQKLQVSLTEAESSLRETELEKYIDEQQKLLDSLVDDTEAWITQRLDDTDRLVAESIDATNKNAETISNTIKETANSYDYGISEQMETIWDSANDVVCTYGDILKGTNENIANNITTGTTNVVNAINGLNGSMQTMIGKLNEIATANANSIAQAQNAVVSGQNNSYPTNNSVSNVTISNGNTSNTGNPAPQPQPKYEAKIDKHTVGKGYSSYEEAKKAIDEEIEKRIQFAIKEAIKGKEKDANVIAQSIRMGLGAQLNSQWSINAYASGTPHAKKGWSWVGEGKDGNEIIIDKDGNALLTLKPQLYNFKGGEQVINGKETSELLTSNLMPLSSEQLWGNIVKTPKLPEMSNGVSGNVTYDVDKVELVLPNVKDYDSLVTEMQHDKRFERIVQSMTTDRLAGKGSISKYKF